MTYMVIDYGFEVWLRMVILLYLGINQLPTGAGFLPSTVSLMDCNDSWGDPPSISIWFKLNM